jgi:hypothetical protein
VRRQCFPRRRQCRRTEVPLCKYSAHVSTQM